MPCEHIQGWHGVSQELGAACSHHMSGRQQSCSLKIPEVPHLQLRTCLCEHMYPHS